MQAWLWWKTRRKFSNFSPSSAPWKKGRRRTFCCFFTRSESEGKSMLASKSLGKREKKVLHENENERDEERGSSINSHQPKKRFQSSNCNIVERNRSCTKITFYPLNNCILWCAMNERIMKLFGCLQLFRLHFWDGRFFCFHLNTEARNNQAGKQKVNEYFIIISYCAPERRRDGA